MSQKILVIGGKGFIGHHLIKKLKLSQQYSITDFDCQYIDFMFPDFKVPDIYQRRAQAIQVDRAVVHAELNFNVAESGTHAIGSIAPESVIFLAGTANAKITNMNPGFAAQTMSAGLQKTIQGAIQGNNLKRFIYISSSMVYGEFENGVARETDICKPRGLYAALKYQGEELVKQYAELFGFEYTIIRPSAVYGPRDYMGRVVDVFLEQAAIEEPIYVKGKEFLDFTYVDDLVHGIYLALGNKAAANETFNITRGQARRLDDLAEVCRSALYSKSKIVLQERDQSYPRRGLLSTHKAQDLLNYHPSFDLERGIYETVQHDLSKTKASKNK